MSLTRAALIGCALKSTFARKARREASLAPQALMRAPAAMCGPFCWARSLCVSYEAMEKHDLIVWAMNGEPLPNIHGGPVRLVIPGWPGSLSHKWLKKITIRDREHDGQGMTGTSYRVTIKPMIPGGKAEDSNFRILESMPVRSI